MTASTWEYFVWEIAAKPQEPFNEFEGKFNSWQEWVSFRLNAFGNDGWEAVSVWCQNTTSGESETFVLLKRKL